MRISRLPRIATIATMASREPTFQQTLPLIHAQVDHVFVYLDHYREPPAFLRGYDRLTVQRAEDLGDLHASSRFLCIAGLAEPSVLVSFDDDILYPPDYVARLTEALDRVDGAAVVGVHGRVFKPPYRSFVADAKVYHFAQALSRWRYVDTLGTGTTAFVTDRMNIDPSRWDRHDMDDIMVSLEAAERRLPRMIVARPAGWLRPIAEAQADSLWTLTRRDDSEQSRRMRRLLDLANFDRRPPSRP